MYGRYLNASFGDSYNFSLKLTEKGTLISSYSLRFT